MQSIYPQGSVWRKWDLHIHSDASDGNGNAEQIITKAKEKGLSVIAITDHHTAKNVDELKSQGDKEEIVVISGIEFRTEYGQKSVHMIGLFPDFHGNIKLDSKALHDLILSPLNLSETQIISKGRHNKAGLRDDEAFKEGMFLVQADFKEAAGLIHKYGGLVVVHAGSKSNSVEEMKHQGASEKNVCTLYESLGVVKQELFEEGYIDICEIRKENDSEAFYWKKFNRPSITASDAHDFNEMGSKSVWIKSDPTFEGLKQIKYEPEPSIRVYIGDVPPDSKDKNRVISSIHLSNSKGWFEDVEMLLNPDLSSIIGPKGSGKTALADIIALAGGDIGEKIKDRKTFIGKAFPELAGTTIKLRWAGGAEDSFTKKDAACSVYTEALCCRFDHAYILTTYHSEYFLRKASISANFLFPSSSFPSSVCICIAQPNGVPLYTLSAASRLAPASTSNFTDSRNPNIRPGAMRLRVNESHQSLPDSLTVYISACFNQ